MRQLRRDELTEELVRLTPEMSVSGGCFSHWLARPATVSSDERVDHLERTRSDATSLCIQGLLGGVGLPRRSVGWQSTGSRKWPPGYVGSVSHKGTKVVAVLGACNLVTSVGVDIELRSGSRDLSAIPGLSRQSQAVFGQDIEDEVITFSVKEAAFKAAHWIVKQPMNFDEVTLLWQNSQGGRFFGVGQCHGVRFDIRCSLVVPRWIVSVALMLRRP